MALISTYMLRSMPYDWLLKLLVYTLRIQGAPYDFPFRLKLLLFLSQMNKKNEFFVII